MSGNARFEIMARISLRRRLLAGVGLVVGSLAVGPGAFAEDAANRTSLHQELRFKASAQRIYEALLSSQQFTALTGAAATIDARVGGSFTMFNGRIVGLNVELVPNQRLVQAWRPTHWDPGVYSVVRFQLKPEGKETLVVLDHTGFPAGEYEHLTSGWTAHYWEPLTKLFGSGTGAAK
jgi:activator of HSP90 ATPase